MNTPSELVARITQYLEAGGLVNPEMMEHEKVRDLLLDVREENRELRILLAIAHAGLSLYTDDGELQDTRVHPHIDYKRDSVAEIERKLRVRSFVRNASTP